MATALAHATSSPQVSEVSTTLTVGVGTRRLNPSNLPFRSGMTRARALAAPVVVIISGPVGDCCRAGQNLMLSAHARGLGTCWVGSPMLWLTTPEVRAEFGIPATLTPVAVLCLGYPAAIPEAVVHDKPPIVWVS